MSAASVLLACTLLAAAPARCPARAPHRIAATSLPSRSAEARAQRKTRQQPGASLHSGQLSFRWWPGGEKLAEALANAARNIVLAALPADILEQPPAITIFLAPDEERFDSLTQGQAPHWGAGVAFPESGVIVLPAYSSARAAPHELAGILRHELAHVALQRYLGGAQVPRWFTEGYAVFSAGQLDESAGWILRLAFLTGHAPPLDSLSLDWPSRTTDARVAYLLSASAVSWLYGNGGERVLQIFLQRWRDGGNFERALFDTYGLDLGHMEKYWSASVRRRYGWLLFVAQSVVLWALTAMLVLFLFLLRRRRNRARMARLEATELPDRPAFWEPGGDQLEPGPQQDPGEPPALT